MISRLQRNRFVRASIRRLRWQSIRWFGGPFRLPNFLIIGAGKAGTTSLHYWLSSHPDVFMPQSKESNFFAFRDEDTTKLDPVDRDWISSLRPNWSDYRDRFRNATLEKRVGEASPMYLYHPAAAGCIAKDLPGVKLIAILREPLECAYSNFRMLSRRGLEKREFLESVNEDRDAPLRYLVGSYLQKSSYSLQLMKYFSHFEKSQIRICFYEDMLRDSAALVEDLMKFLEVDFRAFRFSGHAHNKAPSPTVVPAEIRETLRSWALEETERVETLTGRALSEWRSKLA
jgi:hypothetical protein